MSWPETTAVSYLSHKPVVFFLTFPMIKISLQTRNLRGEFSPSSMHNCKQCSEEDLFFTQYEYIIPITITVKTEYVHEQPILET